MKSTFIIKDNNVFRYILKKGRYAKGEYIVVHIFNKKNFTYLKFYLKILGK